jgi:protein-S-isoprenylcysteine O-methyltransferase Ste14
VNTVEAQPRYLFPKRYADAVQRLRVASGFVLLFTFAWFSNPTLQSMLLGVPICLAGLAVRAWAAGHLIKNERLATTGPYGYIRNPLYAGTLLVAAGIVAASRSLVLGVIFAAAFLLVYLPVIELEEQHLRRLFPEYNAYSAKVNRFLPFRKWHGRAGHFSKAVYSGNQEYKAAAGFAVALLWMIFKCWLSVRFR